MHAPSPRPAPRPFAVAMREFYNQACMAENARRFRQEAYLCAWGRKFDIDACEALLAEAEAMSDPREKSPREFAALVRAMCHYNSIANASGVKRGVPV